MREIKTRPVTTENFIACQIGRFGDGQCVEKATICEEVNWKNGHSKGLAFYYFCAKCHTRNIEGRKQTDGGMKINA